MAKVNNNQDRFSGEFMVQDSDHLSGVRQTTDKAKHGNVRQAEQSHEGGRQQGSGDNSTTTQQGSRRRQAE